MKSAQYDRESIAKADLLAAYSYANAGTPSKQRITHPQTVAGADTQCFNTDSSATSLPSATNRKMNEE